MNNTKLPEQNKIIIAKTITNGIVIGKTYQPSRKSKTYLSFYFGGKSNSCLWDKVTEWVYYDDIVNEKLFDSRDK